MYGRPPFEQIFSSLTQSIEAGHYLPGREATLKTRLGVYFCGVRIAFSLFPLLSWFPIMNRYDWEADVQPSPLARVVRSAAQRSRSETIDVKFYKEHF